MEDENPGGVDPREDWDQAAAAGVGYWGSSGLPVGLTRCPRPSRQLQARYVTCKACLCSRTCVCGGGGGGEKGSAGSGRRRGRSINSNSLAGLHPENGSGQGHPELVLRAACPATMRD